MRVRYGIIVAVGLGTQLRLTGTPYGCANRNGRLVATSLAQLSWLHHPVSGTIRYFVNINSHCLKRHDSHLKEQRQLHLQMEIFN
ncbi:hypothetical protein K449DRAFT_469889 [Hypoxylon sp. EC38]|nr:hypothetical protein K449DRAFT_469889 [Hypoxylon sp. EC38]